MSYTIKWEESGIYCSFSGAVSGVELLQCNKDIYGNPRFDDIKYQIFDMLDVRELSMKEIDVCIVAACDRAAARTNPNVKCALVATDKNAHIMSGIYQSEIA